MPEEGCRNSPNHNKLVLMREPFTTEPQQTLPRGHTLSTSAPNWSLPFNQDPSQLTLWCMDAWGSLPMTCVEHLSKGLHHLKSTPCFGCICLCPTHSGDYLIPTPFCGIAFQNRTPNAGTGLPLGHLFFRASKVCTYKI
jgi:hypothetical protein